MTSPDPNTLLSEFAVPSGEAAPAPPPISQPGPHWAEADIALANAGAVLDSIPGWVWALFPVTIVALMIWGERERAKRRRARERKE